MEYRGQQYVFDATTRIGGGGMADVYLGTRRDAPEASAVAIKVPSSRVPEPARDLFLREAEAAHRVSGPNVVQVVDWGDTPPFIAFEFVEGSTLAEDLRTRQGGRRFWSGSELVDLYRQLVAAMSAINEYVVHRDLKPENIFVQGNTLKISDFGISKYVGEATRSRTFKGWGTLPYMAPETLRGDRAEWYSDQYSLGIVFFEMATLQLPFVGTSDELEHAHLYRGRPV